MNLRNKQRDLIDALNYYTKKYDEGNPEITDEEWDNLYFELIKREALEDKYYEDSPTRTINYQVVNELKKVEHNHKMLSLDKTKEPSEVESFLNNNSYVAMAKLDGLTCSLRYIDGKLFSAETRGNGIVGEDITHNAYVLPTIPQRIPCKEDTTIDGEIICLYNDFKDFEDEYKNPRNFAAGSIRLLNSQECSRRKLTFMAWELISDKYKTFVDKLDVLDSFGFIVVPWVQEDISYAISDIQDYCEEHSIPIDGVVFKFNDIEYGKQQGETAHHKKDAIAFKFYDETYETNLVDISWTMGRTGVLTPVAVFNPVEIDGATVTRASLHNLNIMEDTLGYPYRGEKVYVAKINMIIPQIVRAEKRVSLDDFHFGYPKECPVCGQPTQVVEADSGTVELYCSNPACEGKLINRLDHFCGKKGLDIKGLSKATLEKLVDWGWITNLTDIFYLKNFRSEWINQPGFGIKSVDNILNSIENSKTCPFDSFIASLGIPMIGKTIAADLVKHFNSYEDFITAIENRFDFSEFDGFADAKSSALLNFDYTEANKLSEILTIVIPQTNAADQCFAGQKYVITGSVNHFKNRNELKDFIEARGGKVVSSISGNTNYLINNNINSTSSKNLTAKKLGIPIISEDDLLASCGLTL
jgi:DNA ligase (NAD+)